MSKQRRTVSLDEPVDDYLSRDGVNASELVNKLVRQHMEGGRTDDQIRQFRMEQLKSEYQDLAGRARRKLEQFNELADAECAGETLTDEERQEWFEKVRMVPRETDHPLVQDAADALGMEAADVLREAYDE